MSYPNYYIDNDSLKEVLHDPILTLQWCEANENNPEVVSYYRMLKKLDIAELIGIKFINQLKGTDQEIGAIVRLAAVYHWQEKYKLSEEMYNKALVLFDNSDLKTTYPQMGGFIYQHLAKLYLDFRKFEKAEVAINNAYEIRLHCDSSSLPSTQQVLDKLKKIKKTI